MLNKKTVEREPVFLSLNGSLAKKSYSLEEGSQA